MKTWLEFTSHNGILAWYVNLTTQDLHSMPQETQQEAMNLAQDIECGNVEVIPLEGDFKGLFWYVRNT